MIILIFSILAVAVFVVGLSLTLMVKGHHIDGEISTNKNMQRLGISCVVHDALSTQDCSESSCANCAARCTSDING